MKEINQELKQRVRTIFPLGDPNLLWAIRQNLEMGKGMNIIVHYNFPLKFAELVSKGHPNLKVFYIPKKQRFLFASTDVKSRIFFLPVKRSSVWLPFKNENNEHRMVSIDNGVFWGFIRTKLVLKFLLNGAKNSPAAILIKPEKAIKLSKMIGADVAPDKIVKFLKY